MGKPCLICWNIGQFAGGMGMKKAKKLVYTDSFKEDGEYLQSLIARIIRGTAARGGGLPDSYVPRDRPGQKPLQEGKVE